LGIVGLAAVMIFGHSDFGAQRWIDVGFFQLQPSEPMKLLVIAWLALVLSRPLRQVSYGQFFICLAILGLPALAVLAQPDLGTGLLIFFSGLGVMAHAHLRRSQRWWLVVMLIGLVAIATLSFKGVHPFNSLLKDYQKDRLVSFINPEADRSGSGYNILQSIIAVGSGGTTGRGLGQGSQSQLNFLPVAHADFIFAGISEAWGFVGATGIIVLLGVIVFRVLQAARLAAGEFEMLICLGCAILLLLETFINIGMNIGLMPVTGVPLPFLSYGGTTMLTNALLIGIVESIIIRHKRLTF
jgi:rod shape determining protein RodA